MNIDIIKNRRTPCGHISLDDVEKDVLIMGWIDALRDHGEMQFIHLRDRTGIVQVVFNNTAMSKEKFNLSASLKNEFCIAVHGKVIQRTEETVNSNISTGKVEIIADDLIILSESDALPFQISEKAMVMSASEKSIEQVSEEIRLQYRYLDLRRPSMFNIFKKRSEINKIIRNFLDDNDFIEVETPILTKSTPEGARDYLVPSRVHPKNFYALPQSPQLFKQLLMISGFERYYQIARCFRDEDLRPNRQPEFTQLDLEASFIDEEFIYNLIENLAVKIFATNNISLKAPFQRMKYSDAINNYGSDKPDLRFGMVFVEATHIFKNTSYSIFKQILKRKGTIKGINVKNSSQQLSKNVLQNEYAKQIVPGFGAKGMTWMRVIDNKLESNIVQFFTETEQQKVLKAFNAENGDVLLLIADASYDLVCSALGQLRLHIADRLNIIPDNMFVPLWVTDYPLFELGEDGKISSNHHPFTAPDRTDFDPNNKEELLKLKSRAYDFVVNGEELGGGSIRINCKDTQYKIFKALGLSNNDVKEKFGFFLNAFNYGTPPHGGLALGLDRIISMILKTNSIRDVIAFPKNRRAFCFLTEAPSKVDVQQLEELALLDFSNDLKNKGISSEDKEENIVDYISWVSRIGVKPEERLLLEKTINYAEKIAALIDENKCSETPSFSVIENKNKFRYSSKPVDSVFVQNGDIFKNASSVKGNYFKVANIIE